MPIPAREKNYNAILINGYNVFVFFYFCDKMCRIIGKKKENYRKRVNRNKICEKRKTYIYKQKKQWYNDNICSLKEVAV